jgi:photosystem II stability/assembly factor-like uncharacterized protein
VWTFSISSPRAAALFASLIPALFTLKSSFAACQIQDAASAGATVWLLCRESKIISNGPGQTAWREYELPSEDRLRVLWLLDHRRGIAAGDNGSILRTEDGGETWRRVPVETNENLTAVHFVGETGWLAGWGGVILHSADGGRSWKRQNSGVSQGLESVFFLDANRGWAVGWVGVMLRTTDGGQTWEEIREGAAHWSLSAVYFRDGANGWAVGFGGQILRSRDGGQKWERQDSPATSRLTSIRFDGAGRGWITGDRGFLLSEDGGESWRSLQVEGQMFLTRLLPVQSALWAVGAFGVLKQVGPGWEKVEIPLLDSGSSPGALLTNAR